MMDHKHIVDSVDAPITCQVKVRGTLDELWSGHLGGMNIYTEYTADKSTISVLTGRLQDQAALTGILFALHELGYPLLSVKITSVC